MGPTRMLLGKPVIAAVEGHAVAGGLELALWCDLRVAAADAVFGVYCRRWGVPLIDGGTVRLPRLIGHSHALDLILTGRGVSRRRGAAHGPRQPRSPSPGRRSTRPWRWPHELAALPAAVPAQRPAVGVRAVGPRRCDDGLGQRDPPGLDVIRSGETQEGAARFAAGAGRHGS